MSEQARPSSTAPAAGEDHVVLDIKGGALEPGTPVIVWDQNSPGSPNQWWTLTNEYIRCSSNPDLVLDVQGGVVADGVPMVMAERTVPVPSSQLWTSTPDGCLQNHANPDLVLTVAGFLAPGATVALSTRKSPPSPGQRWAYSIEGYLNCPASAGSVSVQNGGAYIAKAEISYWYAGQWQFYDSGNLLNPNEYSVDVPIGAADVRVSVSVETGFGWSEFVNLSYTLPPWDTILLGGTSLDPTYIVE